MVAVPRDALCFAAVLEKAYGEEILFEIWFFLKCLYPALIFLQWFAKVHSNFRQNFEGLLHCLLTYSVCFREFSAFLIPSSL